MGRVSVPINLAPTVGSGVGGIRSDFMARVSLLSGVVDGGVLVVSVSTGAGPSPTRGPAVRLGMARLAVHFFSGLRRSSLPGALGGLGRRFVRGLIAALAEASVRSWVLMALARREAVVTGPCVGGLGLLGGVCALIRDFREAGFVPARAGGLLGSGSDGVASGMRGRSWASSLMGFFGMVSRVAGARALAPARQVAGGGLANAVAVVA